MSGARRWIKMLGTKCCELSVGYIVQIRYRPAGKDAASGNPLIENLLNVTTALFEFVH
jgi:hypothetical protein